MNKINQSSQHQFFTPALPILSIRQITRKKTWRERIHGLYRRHLPAVHRSLAVLGITCLLFSGTWLFCRQLAEYGW